MELDMEMDMEVIAFRFFILFLSFDPDIYIFLPHLYILLTLHRQIDT